METHARAIATKALIASALDWTKRFDVSTLADARGERVTPSVLVGDIVDAVATCTRRVQSGIHDTRLLSALPPRQGTPTTTKSDRALRRQR